MFHQIRGLPGGKQTGDHMSGYIAYNGLFHRALKKLLDSGFGLSWENVRPEDCVDWQSNTEYSGIFDNRGQRYRLDGQKISSAISRSSIGNTQSNSAQPSIMKIDNTLNDVPAPAKKIPTRIKYTCSPCGRNIWGKRNLNVICGDCKQNFKENIS